MNDDLMFDYLLEMGAMRPEQEEMKRKQAMVEALRGNAMQPLQGQMVGKHYVAPGIANAIAQMGTAYMAKQGQDSVDKAMFNKDYDPNLPKGPGNMPGMNQLQRERLEALRRQRAMRTGGYNVDAVSNEYFGGTQ